MSTSEHQHHSINYIEIGMLDVALAKKFYSKTFGWKFNNYGPDYAGIKGQGREVGGFAKVKSVKKGGPLVILYSDKLELSLKKIERAGGKILKAPFAFPGGRRFHFLDLSGNELAVWSQQ